MRITERAHDAVRVVVRPGDRVVDATLGNGHDALMLAQCVGAEGTVYGFDVQEAAIEATRRRLSEAGLADAPVNLLHRGHEAMSDCVRGPLAAVMFNLGYLPGGDHGLATRTETTLTALGQAWGLLRVGGILSVVCYRGHPGAAEESESVCDWAENLAGARVGMSGRAEREEGPFLVVIRKKGVRG